LLRWNSRVRRLASSRWAERNRDLVGLDAAELGERLLIAGQA